MSNYVPGQRVEVTKKGRGNIVKGYAAVKSITGTVEGMQGRDVRIRADKGYPITFPTDGREYEIKVLECAANQTEKLLQAAKTANMKRMVIYCDAVVIADGVLVLKLQALASKLKVRRQNERKTQNN